MWYLLLLTLALSPAQAEWTSAIQCADAGQGEVSVFWWNIRYGSLDRDALQANLRQLVEHPCRPQVIALGEYEEGNIDPEIQASLDREYEFQQYVPSNYLTSHRGIKLFARMQVSWDRHRYLDWLSPRLDRSMRLPALQAAYSYYGADEARYFDRYLLRLTVTTSRGPLTLYPTHLAQPFASESRLHGRARVIRKLVLDAENPLGYQVQNLLREALPQDAVLFGDLNFPPSVGRLEIGRAAPSLLSYLPTTLGPVRITTPYYRSFLEHGWTDVFHGDGPYSFPTPSAPEAESLMYQLHPFQLDHLFRSSNVKTRATRIIHMAGSDHYPLFFIAQLRDAR